MNLTPGIWKATVRGVPDVTILMTDSRDGVGFTSEYIQGEWRTHLSKNITDARPLIVLDLGKFAYDDMPTILRDTAERHRDDHIGMGGFNVTAPAFLDFIADQIEAQTKPPRIPEPGLWGVVEASVPFNGRRTHYLHDDTDPGTAVWVSLHGRVSWSDLIDPVLIRDGIS